MIWKEWNAKLRTCKENDKKMEWKINTMKNKGNGKESEGKIKRNEHQLDKKVNVSIHEGYEKQNDWKNDDMKRRKRKWNEKQK